jgi:hypothetical protein
LNIYKLQFDFSHLSQLGYGAEPEWQIISGERN